MKDQNFIFQNETQNQKDAILFRIFQTVSFLLCKILQMARVVWTKMDRDARLSKIAC